MRIAFVVYLLLILLVSVNLTEAFGLPIWLCVFPVGILALILGLMFYRQVQQHVILTSLSVAGFVGLAVIAFTYAIPAWEVVFGASTGGWAGKLLPMFFATLALYGAGLWLRGTLATRLDAVDWLASFSSGPGLLLALLTALVLCAGMLIGLDWVERTFEASATITRRFLDRGIIPPATILLFNWGMLILLGKWWNTLYVRRSVTQWQTQTETSVNANIDRIRSLTFSPERLADQLLFLWRRHEESFLIPRYLSWAVPVLGFVGTVLGISLAADGIRGLIASESGLTGLSTELGSAIAPLGIAFDTTLIALTLSLFLTLFQALVQRSEERTLTTLERSLREQSGAL